MNDRVTIITAILIGGWVGSFIAAASYRLPRGQSVVYPPSHCPECKNRIRAIDLLPVIGWLRLSGRCRHCSTSISIKYPMIEAFTACTFGILAWWWTR